MAKPVYVFLNYLRKNRKIFTRYIWLMIIFVLIFALKKLLLTVILMVASFFVSYVMQRLKIRQIGLEFCLFTSVISGMFYGPFVGGLVGFITILVHLLLGGFFGLYILWVIPSYILAGIVAGILPGSEVFIGLIVTVGVNLVLLFFTIVFNSGNLGNFITYLISNCIINALLFIRLAPTLMRLN